MTAWLGVIEFSGSATTGFGYEEIVDWDSLAEAKDSVDDIPAAHGAYDPTELFRESLALTLKGHYLGESPADVAAAKETLKRAITVGAVLDLRVMDALGQIWTRSVSVRGMPIAPDYEGNEFLFEIDMLAHDPIRYSDWITVGPIGIPTHDGGLRLPQRLPWNLGISSREVATVTNGGTEPVLPIIRITGSATALIVHAGPRRIQFAAFAGTLVLDAEARRATLNGTDVTIDLIRREWATVAPNETQQFSFEATAPSPEFAMAVDYRIGVP